MKFVKDSLTGLDGESYGAIKVLGALIVLTYLCLTVAAFITGKPFDMQGFGVGAAAAVGAMGAAIKMTETSEPKAPTPPMDDHDHR